MIKPITPAVSKAIYINLREFGYTQITPEFVAEQVQAIVDGKNPQGIIAMFARGMLVENGYLEEQTQ